MSLYAGSYMRVGFTQTDKGYWLFDDPVPNSPGAHWSRYIADDEMESISQNSPPEVAVPVIEAAIRRALNRCPMYTGDVRYRH